MQLIFISGPSGSGKTTLSNKILMKVKNAIVLSTDNYYKTGILSKLLSKFVKGYFDKSISLNYKLFKEDYNFIIKNGISIHERYYNFKEKSIKIFRKEIKNINFLIVEGIFAKEIISSIYNQKNFLLELKANKKDCMTRAVQRDLKERGKEKKQAERDFLKSWDIYYEKLKDKPLNRNTKEIIITKNTNIDKVIKKYLI